MRIASSPDASAFLLRMPESRETEILNLGRPGDALRENCVVSIGFGDSNLRVYPCREADMPSELPVYASPHPKPGPLKRDDYNRALANYLSYLREKMARGEEAKIVASRVISAPPNAFRRESFGRLCRLYPSAFVFYLSTPETGTWMGASPELLLRRDGNRLFTVALAGTRPAGTPGDWDVKNVREQAMVTDFICDTLTRFGFEPHCSPTSTRVAGPVEHIVTEISSEIGDNFTFEILQRLITELSPTPALSGLPRDDAMKMISLNEPFSRHLYGGCVGRVRKIDNWCFFVNLRSALLTSRATYIYVGGGITALSDTDKEWEETELKAVTMLKVFAPQSIRIPGENPKTIKIGKRKRRRRPRF